MQEISPFLGTNKKNSGEGAQPPFPDPPHPLGAAAILRACGASTRARPGHAPPRNFRLEPPLACILATAPGPALQC